MIHKSTRLRSITLALVVLGKCNAAKSILDFAKQGKRTSRNIKDDVGKGEFL
jgi:hypothetical protein